MRVAVFGILICTGLLLAALGVGLQRNTAFAQRNSSERPAATLPSDQLIALSSDGAEGYQQVTLVDPTKRVMSVYHIDRKSGEITLKSVRNVNWDLQMDEFNGVSPSPREIRSLLEQR